MARMLNLFLAAVFVYVSLIVLMSLFQRKLMYLPDTSIEAPAYYGLYGFDDLRIRTTDGLNLQLWYRQAGPAMPTILYLHGNAAHIGARASIYAAFAEQGFGVAALSFRGYGKSEGSPTEAGLYTDARAAMAFLTGAKEIPLSRIMLYGESLGTGVAVQIATEFNVSALMLQAPYTSVAQRASEIYYFIPVRWLIKDRYDSIGKITRVKAPLLLFHGEKDEIIPVVQGKALFAAATSQKRSFFFPHGAHNDFDSAVISSHVLDFAKEHHLIGQ